MSVQQVLCFDLAGEHYGIPILKVREIQGLLSFTRIPKAPNYMPGVINLRGAIVPIIDLRIRFCLEDTQEGPRPVVVIVEVNGRTLGMKVDAVSDVVDLDDTQIQAAPELGTNSGLGREFISGLVNLHGADEEQLMLILLDLNRLLSMEELQSVEGASI